MKEDDKEVCLYMIFIFALILVGAFIGLSLIMLIIKWFVWLKMALGL